ncbi:hypothetical protein AX14_011267 [Amanita brunnescens Koide BX004]|nr:hypothetical protein AX14_011267 [Amanita brunnescens Koide BX004]
MMTQKWTNPAYALVSRKTRPTHLPGDVPFQRLRTHLVQEQFEYATGPQRPGQRVLDLFGDRITVDTTSPKKGMASFKAWVWDLKIEIEQLHHKPESVTVYTDGAFHHNDYKAAFAFTIPQGNTWHDQYDWCPAASSFNAELRAIEAALEYIIERTACGHITILIDNKAAANSLFNFEVKSSQMLIVWINWLLKDWLSENHQRTLAVRFVPSHEGITGNECADQLTKAGLERCPTNPPPHSTIPLLVRTQVPRRARMAAALERCHIQGVPVAPDSLKEEGLQAFAVQALPQLLSQYGEGRTKPLEPHRSCPNQPRPHG